MTYTYRPRRYLSRLATILMIMIGAYPAQALDINTLPNGGSVSTGSAAIVQGDGRLDINQTTQNVSINWDSFNIGSNAQVNFHQPSSTSVALNRVIGSAGASEIFGHLTSNGYVFLLNPNGVLFSQNAQVNVGGLVASTMGLSDADFLAKRYNFVGNGSFSSVINQGSLTASEGGYIALLAPEVRNEGVITAYLGTVALGAGEQITLDFSGNRLVNLAVDQSAIRALIENRKMIQVDGGTVILAAKSEGDLSATVVNSEGIIQAQSIGNVSGVIRLEGGAQGVVSVAGILDTSGKDLGETGGSIYVLGDKVGLFAGSSIDASGDAGGGTVLVGGDFQGKNLNIQNASFSYVDQGAIINANAISNGNGGKVIVWANDSTRFYGGITAQGGSRGGDGGFAEVSGKQNLTFAGNANLGSLAGKSGTLLMDPNDLYVNTGSVSGSVQDASGPFQAIDGVNNYYVLTSSLSGDTSYTLQASHDVIFNSSVTFGNTGLNTVSITAINNIESNSRSVATSGGALSFNSATMTLGAINTNGGLLTINNSGAVTQTGKFTGVGGLTKIGAGTLTLSQTNSYTGATTISEGTVSLSGNSKLANGSSLVVNGGAFDMNTRTETVKAVKLISGSITGTGILTSSTTFDMQSGTVSAILKGVGLTKTTSGTVTLSGLNLYTGLTTVSAGTLAYGINNALSTGAINVSGGTLDMGTFSDTLGTVTLTSGSITGTTGVLTGTSYAMQSGTASAILGGAGALTEIFH
jgi:trimeric autotransporter adhesin